MALINKNKSIYDYVVLSMVDSSRKLGFYNQEYSQRFRTFDAFDGTTQNSSEYINFDAYAERINRRPLPGEIGCAISHYLIAREFASGNANDNDIILVAEDDAKFIKNINSIIEKIINRINWDDIDIVILGSPGSVSNKRDLRSIPQKLASLSIFSSIILDSKKIYTVGDYYGYPLGTGFYLMTKRAAIAYTEFLAEKNKISWHADDYSSWAEKIGLRIQVARPNLVDFVGESVIGDLHMSPVLQNPSKFLDKVKINLAIRARIKKIPNIIRASYKTILFSLGERK